LKTDDLIQEDNFVSFLKSVRDFCAFIESDSANNYLTFLQSTQRQLQTLYFRGQKLQVVDLKYDLGDIYKDLKNFLLLFDKGSPAEIESAVWTLKWSFDNHWGDHCINANYAIHYFIKNTA